MATLEIVNGGDIGSVAIKKVDRNVNVVNLAVDASIAAHNINTSAHTSKVDKTQIKNDLLQTVTGGVLDSTQGKVLDDKITVLTSKDINLDSSITNLKSVLAIPTIRKYITGEENVNLFIGKTDSLFIFNVVNAPTTGHGWIKNVWYDGSEFSPEGLGATQINYQEWTQYKSNKKFTRQVIVYPSTPTSNFATGWIQIATTDKIDILVTPSAGYSIVNQQNYKINNVIYYNFKATKTDVTAFTVDVQNIVATMSVGARPVELVSAFCAGNTGSTWSGICTGVLSNSGAIGVTTVTTGVTAISISGTVVL